MDKDLKALEQLLNSPSMTSSDLINAMVKFRLCLEKNSLQSTYKYLNLYCNWMVHAEISGSMTAFRILEDLTDSMIEHNTGSDDSEWICDAIIEGLKLHILQMEIIEFGKRFGIDLGRLANERNWKTFGGMLLSSLLDRPICFPEKISNSSMKKIYDAISDKANKAGHLANGVICISFIEKQGRINWSIVTLETKDRNINIIGPMAIITQEMVDKNKKKKS